MIIHTLPGVGKSSLGAYTPSPIFLMSKGETGLLKLIENSQVPETPNVELPDWESTLSFLEQIRTGEHGFKTVVLDVIDGFVKMAQDHACDTKFKGERFGSWNNFKSGDTYVGESLVPDLINALEKIRKERNMRIVCLAHSAKSKFDDPKLVAYDTWIPDMYKTSLAVLHGWADIILFGHSKVYVDVANDKAVKGKAFNMNERVLDATPDPTALAKNRHGITTQISMGANGYEAWANIQEAIRVGRQNKPPQRDE